MTVVDCRVKDGSCVQSKSSQNITGLIFFGRSARNSAKTISRTVPGRFPLSGTIPTFCSFLEPAFSLNVSIFPIFLNFFGNVLNFLSPLCLGTSRFSNSARHMSKSSWKQEIGRHRSTASTPTQSLKLSGWTAEPPTVYDLTSQPNQELRHISLTNSFVMPFHVQCPSHWLGSPYVMCTGNTSIELNAMDMKRPPVCLLHIPRQ